MSGHNPHHILPTPPLILIGMYMYFISYPAIPVISSILTFPINAFYPLDKALILTLDNSLSLFPPSSPPSCLSVPSPGDSYSQLSHGAVFNVCSHSFILFGLTKISVSVKMPHHFLCGLSSRDPLLLFLIL